MQMITEICVDSVRSAIEAERGGADRLELCCALNEGGITPSIGLLRSVLQMVSIPVFVLIRPRGGDFIYSDSEMDVMRMDIEAAREAGCHGLVLGVLTEAHRVDVARTRSLVEHAGSLPITYHRAFDLIEDQCAALEEIQAAGANRVLTSGGMVSALLGVERLKALQQQAGDRVHILAGGGLRSSNVRAIVEGSGVQEVHTSLLMKSAAQQNAGNTQAMYAQGTQAESISADHVREFRNAMQMPQKH